MPLDPSRIVDPGEIFWIELLPQHGSEQQRRRPCVVVSRRILNAGNSLVIVPLSSKVEKANSHRILLPKAEILKDLGCETEILDCVAVCQQVRLIDKKAVENHIGKLSQNALFSVHLGLSYVFDIRY
jgi:mRNA interferase MazF